MAAYDTERHGKVSAGDGAAPDFVAALTLARERALRRAQKLAQRPVELRSHSGDRGLGFAQGGELQIERGGIDPGMVVGQHV